MRLVSLGIVVAALAVSPVFADPREDAEAIVDATIKPETFEAAFRALGGLLVGNIQNEVREAGGDMSPETAALLNDMILRASTNAMVEKLREPLTEVYLASFSEQLLADYRAFLESGSGQEMLLKQPALMLESARVGEAVGSDIGASALEIMRTQLVEGDVPIGASKSAENELREMLGIRVETQPPL